MTRTRNLSDLLDSGGDVKSGALDNVPAADVVNDTTPQLGGDLASNGNDVLFADNDKAIFGAGSDLQIYHDGASSFISDQGTGNLTLLADDLAINTADNTENMIKAYTDGEVELYYNGLEKLATTSSGVSVTGDVYATGGVGRDSGNYIGILANSYMALNVNSGERVRIEADGDLHADGDVIAYSTTISDERLKTNIVGIENAVAKVSQLNGYTFEYKADGKVSAGVIAQEVEAVLPEAVTEKLLPLKTDDGQEYKVVNYDALHGLLIEAVKELSDRIEELEAK